MIRQVRYKSSVVDGLKLMKRLGNQQHVTVILKRCSRLRFDAEKRPDCVKFYSDPDLYKTIIESHELEGQIPPEGYEITFMIDSETVTIVNIRYIAY